jgi:hypothetical protein
MGRIYFFKCRLEEIKFWDFAPLISSLFKLRPDLYLVYVPTNCCETRNQCADRRDAPVGPASHG